VILYSLREIKLIFITLMCDKAAARLLCVFSADFPPDHESIIKTRGLIYEVNELNSPTALFGVRGEIKDYITICGSLT